MSLPPPPSSQGIGKYILDESKWSSIISDERGGDDPPPSETEMKISKVQYSNKEINEAGKEIVATERMRDHVAEWSEAFQKVGAFRESYAYPLRMVKILLGRHTRAFDPEATLSGRSKRMSSIMIKLMRMPHIAVTAMQDIAGCRAVVDTIDHLQQLKNHIWGDVKQKLGDDLSRMDDYIWERGPKVDGYRSVHFVVRYQSRKYPEVASRKIEIQIRTRLQHQWAAAVETVDLFTGQTLKTGGGDPKWKRFFSHAGTLFAMKEKCPLVPQTPNAPDVVAAELRALCAELDVFEVLNGWSRTIDVLKDGGDKKKYIAYLITLNTNWKISTVKGYTLDDYLEAARAYLKAEEESTRLGLPRSSVLVSVDSAEELKAAFPSYYADTETFLDEVKQGICQIQQ